MKTARNTTFKLLGLLAALHLSPAFAAGTVFQKAATDGAIELSNIDDGDAAQVPVLVDKTPAQANPSVGAPGRVTPLAKARKPVKKLKPGSEADEEDAADPENSEVATQDKPGADDAQYNNAGATRNDATAGAAGYANPTDMGRGVVTSGAVGGANTVAGGASNTGAGNAGSGTGGTAPGTTTAGGASDTGGTTSAGATGTGTNAAGTDTANLDAALQRYRQLMLQSGAVQAPNPALTRRYLMVDRATYRGMLGL